MKIKNEMTERNTREPFLHTPIRTWNDPPRQVQHFTFVCTRQQKSCFAGKPELKKLSKSTCLSTNLRLFPKDEEGGGGLGWSSYDGGHLLWTVDISLPSRG